MKKTITKLLILTIAFTFALSANYIFAVWTGPTQAPPGGNTPTPIHVGTTAQVKDGPLALTGLLVSPGPGTNGETYLMGNVGINEITPATGGEQDLRLDVEGAIGAMFYCDEDGNNCVAGNSLSGDGGGHGDGTNCPAGQTPMGVDSNGNVQGCFIPSGGGGDGWVEDAAHYVPFDKSCEYKFEDTVVGTTWYATTVTDNEISTAWGENDYLTVLRTQKQMAFGSIAGGVTVRTYRRCG